MSTFHLQAGDVAESHIANDGSDLKTIADRARFLARQHGRAVTITVDDKKEAIETVGIPDRTLRLQHDEPVDAHAGHRTRDFDERHLVKGGNAAQLRAVAERAADLARSTGQAISVFDENDAPLFVVRADAKTGALDVRSALKDEELDAAARDFKKHAAERQTLKQWSSSFFGGRAAG